MKKSKDMGQSEKKKSFVNSIPERISSGIKYAKDIDFQRIKGMNKTEAFEKMKIAAKNKGVKEDKIKREFRQIEKGIIMIVCSLVIGFMVYSWFYVPVNNDFTKVEIKQTESNQKRLIVQAQVEGKAMSQKRIVQYTKELEKVKAKYPNVRTQNECIYILSKVVEAHGVKPDNINVGMVTPVTKMDISTSIQQKVIMDKLNPLSSAYFSSAVPEEGNMEETAGMAEQNPEDAVIETTNFEYMMLGLSVSELTKEKAYEIIESIKKDPRIIITESLRVYSEGEAVGNYSIEGNFYFYAYREDKLKDLFG